MEPYEGTEPYIFMSYARKDWERVKPFLDALSNAGYRVWYDAGIQAGEHWTETLVEKVEGCVAFCPLFSVAFNASRFCFEETEYAYRKDKTIVPIYLEEPGQMELRPLYRLLQSRQDLRQYQYADAAEFAERLARELVFAPCKVPEWNKIGQIQWRLSADGVLTIARNQNLSTWYRYGSIPDYQKNPHHKGSTAPWMLYCEKIFSVAIADDIRTIGDCAFQFCENLTDVQIPDSVIAIGKWAFNACRNLTNIHIPNSVTTIGDWAFSACDSLTNVHIPNSVTTIGDRAFASCKSMTNVRIPDSVIEIDDGAFENCKILKSVEIPAGAKVADNAFPEHTHVIRRGAAQ